MASVGAATGEKMISSGSPDANISKKTYNIRQLDTRSVTLFPTGAQVVREIKDIPLKVGINQIIFVGLTPTLDESSIKIEGTGAATISDIIIESLHFNGETFQDVYPDTDPDSSNESSDDEKEEGIKSVSGTEELRTVREEIHKLRMEQEHAEELTASAHSRLRLLDSYTNIRADIHDITTDDSIVNAIEVYKAERAKVYEDNRVGKYNLRQVQDKISQLAMEEVRLSALVRKETDKAIKAKMKAAKAKRKEKEDQQRKKQEQAREKARIRKEAEMFWARQIYTVRVNLEVRGSTPVSSRRSSVSGHIDVAETSPEDGVEAVSGDSHMLTCDLTLSYVTVQACWSPSYDLALSTTANTGSLCFDALLMNKTSETWNNCKITLSTSQTKFTKLDEAIPTLAPWRVSLASGDSAVHGGIVYSREEQDHRDNLSSQNAARISQPRLDELFGRQNHIWQTAPSSGVIHYRSNPSRNEAYTPAYKAQSSATRPRAAASPHPQPSQMAFQESSFEESGLTVTYDLPGLKCLPPSTTLSKQRVARVSFTEVDFSYTVVAKLNPVAYLQAKLRNTGELTLLKGPVGYTLDGGFLGRSTFPRCIPGSSFKLNLGVDPAIQVVYPRPKIHYGQLGVFSRDNSTVYTRTLTIHNDRTGPKSKVVHLTALDQVPVSGNTRLHVVILQPKGLAVDGSATDSPSTGEIEVASAEDVTWGKAVAKMKDGGQIAWDVTINPGCTAELILQYQCVYPTGETTVNV